MAETCVKVVRAKVVDGCKGSNKVLFESSDGLFGGVDTMVMWRDQLDCHPIGGDVLLNRFGVFVVHDIQC